MLWRRLLLSLICIGSAALCSATAFADDTTVTVEVVMRQCSDGIDNDGDALIDYPNDPDCDSPNDDSEGDGVPPTSDDDDGGGRASSSYRRGTLIQSAILFRGIAQPNTWVFAFEGDDMIGMVQATVDGTFTMGPIAFSPAQTIFTLYAFDPVTGTTTTHAFPLTIPRYSVVTISGIALGIAPLATTTTATLPPILFLDVVATDTAHTEYPIQSPTESVRPVLPTVVTPDAVYRASLFVTSVRALLQTLYDGFFACPTPYDVRVFLASVQFLQPLTPFIPCTVLWFSDPFSARVFDAIVGVYDSIRRR